MKKVIILCLVIVLFISGCSIVQIENQSIDEIVDSLLTNDSKLKSVSLEGYSYFLPQGVFIKKNDAQNSIFLHNHKKMYMYVDVISYYHKVENEYQKNSQVYYSLPIEKDGKFGYLEINKTSTNYFIEFMYNYTKIEAYADESDLKKTITVMAYILNSIQFQDSVIESLVGENSLNYSEELFNIFTPNGEENNFLDYAEQYDSGRLDNKDEDIFELDDNLE